MTFAILTAGYFGIVLFYFFMDPELLIYWLLAFAFAFAFDFVVADIII
jgi:hypothetical protein